MLPGNSAITAHFYLADGTPGSFVNLDDLRWGNEIQVVSGEVVFVSPCAMSRTSSRTT